MAYEYYGYPADWLTRYRSAIEKANLADVNRVIDKYIHKDQLAVLVQLKIARAGEHRLVVRPLDLEKPVALDRHIQVAAGLLQRSLPEPFAGRLREDDMHLRYAENTAGFYYRLAQAAQARRQGDLEGARAFWRQAKSPSTAKTKKSRAESPPHRRVISNTASLTRGQ